ncbi:hypothetical protein HDU76_010011 [Blyttiomyces sp. JEL0837]|nr:hypothetical protein HDU76_010011 [Blyttiomyces sp. JEL0837]
MPPRKKETPESVMSRVLKTVTDYTEKGRQVAELFLELVSAEDYPDYYQIITQPMALETIQAKIIKGEYSGSFAAFEQDFAVMIANAKIYNRKGSEVHKDAMTLQALFAESLANEIKVFEARAAEEPPVVQPEPKMDNRTMHDTMRNVLKKIMTMKSEKTGSFTFENFFQLPDATMYPDYYEKIKTPICLEGIRKKVTGKDYRVITDFEVDIATLIKNAKEYNIEGSEIYREAQHLEKVFLSLTGKHDVSEFDRTSETVPIEFIEVNGDVFRPGEYCYIANPTEPDKPTIGQVTSTFLNSDGRPSFTATWFLRPEQTHHKANTKFMTNEVLKSNRSETYLSSEITGRCWVMYVKDYVRGRPKGCDLNHVYVCESRYNDQSKTTSRIKIWNQSLKFKEPELDLYDIPLIPSKVQSAFASDEIVMTTTTKKRKMGDDNSDSEGFARHGSVASDGQPGRDMMEAPVAHPEKRIKLTIKPPSTTQQKSSTSAKSNEPAAIAQDLGHANNGLAVNHELGLATGDITSMLIDSGLEAHLNKPTVVPIKPSKELERTNEGDLKWFAAPPIDIIPLVSCSHTFQYLAKRRERAQQRASRHLLKAANVSGSKTLDESDVASVFQAIRSQHNQPDTDADFQQDRLVKPKAPPKRPTKEPRTKDPDLQMALALSKSLMTYDGAGQNGKKKRNGKESRDDSRTSSLLAGKDLEAVFNRRRLAFIGPNHAEIECQSAECLFENCMALSGSAEFGEEVDDNEDSQHCSSLWFLAEGVFESIRTCNSFRSQSPEPA